MIIVYHENAYLDQSVLAKGFCTKRKNMVGQEAKGRWPGRRWSVLTPSRLHKHAKSTAPVLDMSEEWTTADVALPTALDFTSLTFTSAGAPCNVCSPDT